MIKVILEQIMHKTLTIETLKRISERCIPHPQNSHLGCFVLEPPVQVIGKESGFAFQVFVVNESGSHPGCVKIEFGGIWHMIDFFRLPNTGEVLVEKPKVTSGLSYLF